MAMRFWTPLSLVLLACIFKQKWNPVSGNHNPNVTRTIFSLSVIKALEIRSIWCSASFDRQLHNHFTRWRRYDFAIRPSFTSLLLLGGDIELNPGPAQKQEKIDNIHINQCQARKNRKHLMSVVHLNVRSVVSRENFYLLKETVTTNNFDIFTVAAESRISKQSVVQDALQNSEPCRCLKTLEDLSESKSSRTFPKCFEQSCSHQTN